MKASPVSIRRQVQLCIGKAGTPVGSLVYVRQGRRENCAIGKFPSVGDTRSVTRGEVLALKLASQAGIDAAPARIVQLEAAPVAVIRRFDRDGAVWCSTC